MSTASSTGPSALPPAERATRSEQAAVARAWMGWLRVDSVLTDDRGWAFNLAIFRIVFLVGGALPVALAVLRWSLWILPGLPRSVWHPVSFYALLPIDLLANPLLAQTLALACVVLILLGAVGLFTRWTLGLAAVVSLYVIGLPMNQGKVDHFHHVVWFIALLAVGPSGRFLSVDALRDAVRAADRGHVESEHSRGTALLTLRFIWALFGLIYVAPGLAKLHGALTGGWATPESLQEILHARWLNLRLHSPDPFIPPALLGSLPAPLLTAAGLGVVAFEVGVIAFIWLRPVRPFVALAGLAFHRGSRLVLSIPFSFLTPAYVGLFDWSAIGRRLTRRFGGAPLVVLYDGRCRLCRRAMAILRALDAFDAIEAVASDDLRRGRYPEVTDEALSHDLHALSAGASARGYDAYLRIARRVPLLWPAALVMAVPAMAVRGRRLYRAVAGTRACAVAQPGIGPSAPFSRRQAVIAVGSALVAGQAVVSGAQLVAWITGSRAARARWFPISWPFDHYPRFVSERPRRQIEVWEPRLVASDGREARFPPGAFLRAFGSAARTANVIRPAVELPDAERRRGRSLDLVRALWPHVPPELRADSVEVRVYAAAYRLAAPPPVIESERLLDRFDLADVASAPGRAADPRR